MGIFSKEEPIALVTGADSGLGASIALALAEHGANIIVAYHQNKEGAETTVSAIIKLGKHAMPISYDLNSAISIQHMFDKVIQDFGCIDILVNNATVNKLTPLLEITEAEWDRVLNINLKGVFLCTQRAIREMIAQESEGRIISITSTDLLLPEGVVTAKNCIPFHVSKGGVNMLTMSMANELIGSGITVNAITLRFLKQEGQSLDVEELNQTDTNSPEREISLEEVGYLATFLASTQAEDITGAIVIANVGTMQAFGLTVDAQF